MGVVTKLFRELAQDTKIRAAASVCDTAAHGALKADEDLVERELFEANTRPVTEPQAPRTTTRAAAAAR